MLEKLRKLAGNQKLRFLAIGTINTLIDFSLLFILAKLVGLPDVAANIVSVSVALTFSFFANRKYTFKSTGNRRREIVLFLIFTLFGLWVLQSIIIWVFGQLFGNSDLILLIAKIAATAVTLVWNFITYKNFVFKEVKRG